MALLLGTHDGPFHADDVLAAALIRAFLDPDARVVRSRDPEVLAMADVVYDVGGVFDPATRRFDHHQRDYEGNRSSAGMVLDWLEAEGHVAPAVAELLRSKLVDYVDAVDVGARTPSEGVPCFSMLVGVLVERGDSPDSLLHWYERAASMALDVVESLQVGYERGEADAAEVRAAMRKAESGGRSVLELDRYLKWKPTYFADDGAEHPTEFVLFPTNRDWRVVTIPVAPDTREDKRKLPEAWAGLEGEALSEVTGVSGAVFCHRNRFIAVFETKEAALAALDLILISP